MIKKVFFLRHNSLEGNYADYNKLSFEDLRSLGINDKELHISNQFPSAILDQIDIDTNFICYTSSLSRTSETAKMLGFSKIISTDLLNEIYFDIIYQITEADYVTGGLVGARDAFWESFFNRNIGIESPELVLGRIRSFISGLSSLEEENIVVVSHGFFLQMVKCLFIRGIDFTKITHEEFLKLDIKPVNYLESFEVNLESSKSTG